MNEDILTQMLRDLEELNDHECAGAPDHGAVD
jgi:hypothetical protein